MALISIYLDCFFLYRSIYLFYYYHCCHSEGFSGEVTHARTYPALCLVCAAF